jgi:hypothetical protein
MTEQFLLEFQERMVYVEAQDVVDLLEGQLKGLSTVIMNELPQQVVFAHFAPIVSPFVGTARDRAKVAAPDPSCASGQEIRPDRARGVSNSQSGRSHCPRDRVPRRPTQSESGTLRCTSLRSSTAAARICHLEPDL